jgi:hypothetical protein
MGDEGALSSFLGAAAEVTCGRSGIRQVEPFPERFLHYFFQRFLDRAASILCFPVEKERKISMRKCFVIAAALLGASFVPAAAGSWDNGGYVNGFDQYGTAMHGNVAPGGHIDAFDQYGRYMHGNVSPGGHVDMFDGHGNHSNGYMSGY